MDLAAQDRSNLKQRLAILYTAIPKTEAQRIKREALIEEIETILGMRELKISALVENGELDDVEGFRK